MVRSLVKLAKPEIRPEKFLGFDVGLRPCRKSGPLLGVERNLNKMIIHNYGHGGYGVTVAPATCHKAI